MQSYFDAFINGYTGYASHLWKQITSPGWHNYFYALILVSLFFLALEWLRPWRKQQAKFRKDFWLDAFYMFFNFFLFWLIIYNASSDVVVKFFNDVLISLAGLDLQSMNPLRSWPMWAILLVGFLFRDFIQWWTHRLLHRSSRLWEFHKVHHSVEQMGFAAHLRYHWMETLVYRSIEYIPLALLGIGLYDFFVIHILSLVIGHYNHSNITISGRVTGLIIGVALGVVFTLGLADIHFLDGVSTLYQIITIVSSAIIGWLLLGPFMKFIFNSPEMHIWHHAYNLPKGEHYGINFGISLALWDYLFGTARIPHSGRDIKLGFPEIENFPKSFAGQLLQGFRSKAKSY